MRAFTVNVGINTSKRCLGRSAPIYPDGTFDYIPIPSSDSDNPTYADLGFQSVFERMGISHKLEKHVHHDPEFVTFTFGDFPTRSRTSRLKEMDYGDLLLFIASLKRTEHEAIRSSFQKWIAKERGMYLIGMFEIEGLLTRKGEVFKKLGRKAYKRSPHYEWIKEYSHEDSWIFKGSDRSFLFPVAVPIRRADLKGLYGIEPSETSQTETAQVSSYTRTARKIKNLEHLRGMLEARGIRHPTQF